MFTSEYWKNKLSTGTLDWKNIGHLDQQLGIQRDPNSQLGLINQDLFGTGPTVGLFTALDGQVNGLANAIDNISAMHSLRNIVAGAQGHDAEVSYFSVEEARSANARAQQHAMEAAQKNQASAMALLSLEQQIKDLKAKAASSSAAASSAADAAAAQADLERLQLEADRLKAEIALNQSTIATHTVATQAANGNATMAQMDQLNNDSDRGNDAASIGRLFPPSY